MVIGIIIGVVLVIFALMKKISIEIDELQDLNKVMDNHDYWLEVSAGDYCLRKGGWGYEICGVRETEDTQDSPTQATASTSVCFQEVEA